MMSLRMLSQRHWGAIAIAAVATSMLGCDSRPDLGGVDAGNPEIRATARMKPTQGNATTGTVSFSWQGNGTRLVASFENLPPGRHGFHVHEYGDCSAADASSAGGHFAFVDPASPPDTILGNLGELRSGPKGKAKLETDRPEARLAGPRSILGKAVVVHSRGNDASKPPGGNAGARIACGVIERTD